MVVVVGAGLTEGNCGNSTAVVVVGSGATVVVVAASGRVVVVTGAVEDVGSGRVVVGATDVVGIGSASSSSELEQAAAKSSMTQDSAKATTCFFRLATGFCMFINNSI